MKSSPGVFSRILRQEVIFADDCVGEDVEEQVAELQNGDIMLLENLRFHAEEEGGDTSFAQSLARLGDIFVNDAFGNLPPTVTLP